MATYLPDRNIPGLVNWWRNVRNGEAPNAAYVQTVTKALNHISSYRKKCFYSYSRNWNDIPAAQSADRNCSWGYVWTGYNTKKLEFMVGHMITTTASVTDCRIKIVITRQSDASTQTLYYYNYGFDTGHSAGATPEKINWSKQSVTVNPNEAYSFMITEENYAQFVSACAYELGGVPCNTTDTGVFDQMQGAAGGPILDSDTQSLTAGSSKLWARNSQVLAWWSADTSGWSTTSTTYTNIIDRSSTSVAATSPGFTIDLNNHALKSKTTVPVRMAIYAQRTGAGTASNNKVKFTNGTDAIEKTGITTLQWYTVDGTLPKAAADKYDFMMRSSGDTLYIYGAVVLAYV